MAKMVARSFDCQVFFVDERSLFFDQSRFHDRFTYWVGAKEALL